MYNILLTDDEKIVIDSLTFILNKNFQDEIQIFSALSGPEALEITETKKIDIVFMDIHMPGMNGLETIKLMKQINPNLIIIILSAYDQFQYAQEAINLGAYKYLTKPVNRNLILQTVKDSFGLVDRQRGKLSQSIEMHKKLNIVSSMVESDFIYSCIFNSSKNVDFSTYLKYFEIENTTWFMCCIEVFQIDQDNKYNVYMKIRDILTSKARCIIGSFMANRIGVFVPFKTDEKNSYESVKSLMNTIFTLLSTNIRYGIKIGVSKIESDINKTFSAYNDAISALNTISQSRGISFYSEIETRPATHEEIKECSKKLLNRIRLGDAGSVRQLVSLYCTTLFDFYQNNLDKIKNAIFEFIVNLRNAILEMDNNYKDSTFEQAFTTLSKTDTTYELEQFVLKSCMECVTLASSLSKNNQNPIISQACEYLENHISEEITLESAASQLNVSSFYLSKLFKKEKGENFISYLTDLRLKKAKNLLQDKSLIIKEITAAVGYNDQNYFSKLFKNKFGITPTEYRNSLTIGD
ncbi:MAG: response regulator [Treponema sp.]|nr:response regulator [Treponema sp.]